MITRRREIILVNINLFFVLGCLIFLMDDNRKIHLDKIIKVTEIKSHAKMSFIFNASEVWGIIVKVNRGMIDIREIIEICVFASILIEQVKIITFIILVGLRLRIILFLESGL